VKSTSKTTLATVALALSISGVYASAQVVASSQSTVVNSLGNATGIAVDSLGNVYATDSVNNSLVTVQGGNGSASNVITGLSSPGQVAVDASRNVYIANGTSKQVLKIPYQSGALNLNGTVKLGAGLGAVTGVAVDLLGNVYIVDATNKQVVKLSGTTQTALLSTGLTAPNQIAVDRLGNVYIADSGANAVVWLPAGGGAPSTVGTGLNAPTGVATDSQNNVYISDTGNGRVVIVPNVSGSPATGSQAPYVTGITSPGSLALDTRGTLFIEAGTSLYRYTATVTATAVATMTSGGGLFFGLLPVGTTSQTFPVTVTFTASVAPATISVVTTGIGNLDYKNAGGGTCNTTTSYSSGQTCTINVTFTPLGAGPRYGAIVFYSSANKVLGRVFLGGGGLGPVLTVDPGTSAIVSPVGPGAPLNESRGITVDAAGDIFLANVDGGDIVEVTPGTTADASTTPSSVPVTITGFAVGSNIVTFTTSTAPPYVAGESVKISGLSQGTYLNGLTLAVTSASPTGFTANFTFGTVPTTVDSGTATPYFASVAVGPPPSIGNQGVAINGAGDLIVGTAGSSVTVYPYENGTWSTPDAILVSGGAGSKNRVAKTDVAGNIYFCDNGTPAVYEIPRISGGTGWGAPIKLSGTAALGGQSPACTGVAVDLYGNLAASNGATVLYVPATGATPYSVGTGLAPWGLAFDPSGSIWAGNNSGKTLVRIPNENGTLATSDAVTLGEPQSFNDIWVDSSGNVYGAQAVNNTTTFEVINRSLAPLVFASEAIGTATAAQKVILGNDGNLAPVYTNGGTFNLFDVDDFPAQTASAPVCNFLNPLTPGFTCNLAYAFDPTSSGVRTEQVEVASSNSATAPSIFLAAVSSSTVSGTVTLSLALTTPSTGSPAPFEALAITATAKPSANTTPTGAITFSIDGVVTSTTELSSAAAVLSIPTGLAAGSHTITATYAGDKNYQPITTAITYPFTVVLATSTVALTTSGVDVAVGQALTLTGLVPTQSGLRTPTGTLTFTDATTSTTLTPTCSLNSGGDCSISVSTLAVGTHSLCVSYSGDVVYTSAKSSCISVSVGNYIATSTVLSPTTQTSFAYGTPLTMTATITPASGTLNGGAVVFTLDGYPQSVGVTGNTAVVVLSSIAAGQHILAACYSGTTTFASSCAVSSYSFTITKAITTTTLGVSATSLYGSQTITLTGTVSSTTSSPTGLIGFYNGIALVGTAPITTATGVAILQTTQLSVGSPDNITACYLGDSNDLPSCSVITPVTVLIIPTTISLSNAPTLVASGGTTTLTATVSTTVPSVVFSGVVSFYSVNGATSTLLGTGNISALGVASFTVAGLTAESSCFTASYAGTPISTPSGPTASTCTYVSDTTGTGVIATASLGTGLVSATGVAVDLPGNVYITDSTSGAVDLISIGTGTQSAAISSLTAPAGVAVDGNGDLFFTDGTKVMEAASTNGTLGTPTTLVTGFTNLSGIAVDTAGDVYFTDSTKNQLWELVAKATAPTQLFPTFSFTNPQQVAVDSKGDLYIADGTGNRVVYAPAGSTTPSTIGTGLLNPTGVAVDVLGNAYISDTGNNRVLEISGATQTVLIPTITAPGQLTLDNHQALYITTGKTVTKWRSRGAAFQALIPGKISSVYTVTFTFQIATTPSEIEILTYGVSGLDYKDAGGSTCIIGTTYAAGQTCTVNVTFTPTGPGVRAGSVVLAVTTGQPLVTAYLGGVGYAPQITMDTGKQVVYSFGAVNGIAAGSIRGVVADSFGNVYACDTLNGRIVATNATQTTSWELAPVNCAEMTLDGAGNLLVTAGSIYLFPNENGTISGTDYYAVTPAYNAPRGVATDGFGNVYVANTSGGNVYMQPIGGATSTQYVVPFTTIGQPYGVGVDWLGNVAVSDWTNLDVEYLPANGSGEYQLGPSLCSPYPLAMDGGGAVYTWEYCSPGPSTPGKDVVRLQPAAPSFLEEPIARTSGNAEAMWIDPQGNIWTTNATSVIEVVRSTATNTVTFPSTAVGSTAALTEAITNSGPATAVFSNPPVSYYFDSGDFSLGAAPSAACNITTVASMAPGIGCNQAFTFAPLQSGTRTADVLIDTNGSTTGQMIGQLVGTGTSPVTPTATTLTLAMSSPANGNPAPGQSVTFTSSITPSTGETGTVTLTMDGIPVSVQPVAATLTFPLPSGMTQGFHTVCASYSGDSQFVASSTCIIVSAAGSTTSATTLTLSATTWPQIQNQTTTTLNDLVSPYVTLTMKVTGPAGNATPTGSVLVYDGATLLGSPVLASGGATFTISVATLGVHNLTAAYAGNATYNTSKSAVTPLTIVYPGDFILTTAPTSLTITPGIPGSVPVTATPVTNALGGVFYQGNIGLTCSGLPQYSTCAFQPGIAYLDGTGTPTNSTLTIYTETRLGMNNATHEASAVRLCLLPAGALLLLLGAGGLSRKNGRRCHRPRTGLLLFVLGILFAGLTACGSHLPLATPTGTYQVVITGAGQGNITHTVTLQVTIQQ